MWFVNLVTVKTLTPYTVNPGEEDSYLKWFYTSYGKMI